MPPSGTNDEEDQERIGDEQRPFGPPDQTREDPAVSEEDSVDQFKSSSSTEDYPGHDSKEEDQEVYDDGAGIDEPNKGNSVVDYDPEKDKREKDS
jgi:hypothetical protein